MPAFAATKGEVLTTYADIAHAGYEDSLTTAQALNDAVDALIADPSDDTLAAARVAWIAAREPYQQTEVYRFGNPIVDDWEGKVNAWPLDEGLIDYTEENAEATDENPHPRDVRLGPPPDRDSDRVQRRRMPTGPFTGRRRPNTWRGARPARSWGRAGSP